MILFIGNIPAYSKERDFVRFLARVGSGLLNWMPFVPRLTLRKCQLLRIEDPQQRTVEYHGLVSIQPTKSAQDLLRKLNGRKFQGKPVEVRRYHKRSFRMDRRVIHADPSTLKQDRRHGDRRRPALKIEVRSC